MHGFNGSSTPLDPYSILEPPLLGHEGCLLSDDSRNSETFDDDRLFHVLGVLEA